MLVGQLREKKREPLVFRALLVDFGTEKNQDELVVRVALAVQDNLLRSHSRADDQLLAEQRHQGDIHRVDRKEIDAEEGKKLLGTPLVEAGLLGKRDHDVGVVPMLRMDSAEELLRDPDTADIPEGDRKNQVARLCNLQPLLLVAFPCDDQQEVLVETKVSGLLELNERGLD